jgi:hypothetical protein
MLTIRESFRASITVIRFISYIRRKYSSFKAVIFSTKRSWPHIPEYLGIWQLFRIFASIRHLEHILQT